MALARAPDPRLPWDPTCLDRRPVLPRTNAAASVGRSFGRHRPAGAGGGAGRCVSAARGQPGRHRAISPLSGTVHSTADAFRMDGRHASIPPPPSTWRWRFPIARSSPVTATGELGNLANATQRRTRTRRRASAGRAQPDRDRAAATGARAATEAHQGGQPAAQTGGVRGRRAVGGGRQADGDRTARAANGRPGRLGTHRRGPTPAPHPLFVPPSRPSDVQVLRGSAQLPPPRLPLGSAPEPGPRWPTGRSAAAAHQPSATDKRAAGRRRHVPTHAGPRPSAARPPALAALVIPTMATCAAPAHGGRAAR